MNTPPPSRRSLCVMTLCLIVTSIMMGLPIVSASAAISPQGTGSCPSGRLCRWTGQSYQGTMSTVSSVGVVTNVSGTWPSLYVNRSGGAVLYSGANGSGYSACFGPGRTAPSLSGWQAAPGSVKLLTGSCP